jgi:hypothetical protein
MAKDTVKISKKKLQKLLDSFFEMCNHCDELDIYEHEELDKSMQKMQKWAEKNFGRDIDKEKYE